MKTKLIEAGLWNREETGEPGRDISSAWSILSRVGSPGRYVGRTQNGLYEYVIVNADSETLLPSGRGRTLAMAICKAALAVRTSDQTRSA